MAPEQITRIAAPPQVTVLETLTALPPRRVAAAAGEPVSPTAAATAPAG